jgi:RNA polymerase sigma-54 factor
MNCTKDKVFETVEKVSVLNPSPAINYSTEVVNHIIPDVVIENINGEWDVQVNDPGVPAIGLSNQYIKMLENNKDASVKNFIKQKINKAKWFISAIEQRNSTMIKVMKSIIDKQKDYFDSDDRLLVPMILKDVALDVDMDISTISRVTNGKYVQMPWGTKELKRFFSEGIKLNNGKIISSVVFKEKLKLFLDNEDKTNPYTDEQLTKELNKKGYDIARRTVSKYREMLKIPVARLRKI